MTGRHAPAPTRPSRLWLGLMATAVTGIAVPPTVLVARAAAPQVAADERLALTPERSPEPVGHGGVGGPLVLPSIGASGAWEPPESRTLSPEGNTALELPSRTAQRRSAAPVPTLRVTGTPQTTPEAVLSQSVAITGTPEPSVTEPTQAATTEATETAATTEAATTTTEATTTTADTTSETTTATVDVTVSATETTTEGQ